MVNHSNYLDLYLKEKVGKVNISYCAIHCNGKINVFKDSSNGQLYTYGDSKFFFDSITYKSANIDRFYTWKVIQKEKQCR